jgi:hypothetical protein
MSSFKVTPLGPFQQVEDLGRFGEFASGAA